MIFGIGICGFLWHFFGILRFFLFSNNMEVFLECYYVKSYFRSIVSDLFFKIIDFWFLFLIYLIKLYEYKEIYI